MPKIVTLTLDSTLRALKDKVSHIKKLNGTVASHPRATLEALEELAKLAETLNTMIQALPREKQAHPQAEISRIRTTQFDAMISVMRREAKKALVSEKVTQERNKRLILEREELQTKAKMSYDDTFPQLKQLAESFLAKANYVNKDTLFNDYKELQSKVQSAVNNLAPELRGSSSAELNELSHQVNVHKEQLDLAAADERTKAQIKIVVNKAYASVEKMSFNTLLMLMAPAAVQSELAQIMEKEPTYFLTQQESIQDDARHNSALMQLESMLPILTVASSDSTIGKFITKISNDITELASGKKTHLSVLANVAGVVQVTHIDIKILLNNPQQVISEMAFAMHKAGIRDHDMAITLSSPEEVMSSSLLQGRIITNESVAELTEHVLSITGNNEALSDLIGYPVSTETIAEKSATALDPEQMTAVVKAVATIFQARAMLVTAASSAIENRITELSEPANVVPAAVEFLTSVTPISAAVPMTPPKPAPASPRESFIDSVERTPSVATPQVVAVKRYNVNSFKIQFELQLGALRAVRDDLNNRSKNDIAYIQVADQANTLSKTLETNAAQFFGNHIPVDKEKVWKTLDEIKQFNSSCKEEIAKASEFNNHRGVWHREIHPIIKGILGVLAALTMIPALAFAFTKQGYVNTFFAKPQTHSAEVLAGISGLIDECDKLEASARANAPRAA